MSAEMQILAVSISLLVLVVILELVRRGRLREEYSLLWLAAAAVLLIIAVLRGSLHAVARLLGVAYPPSLLFAVAFLFTVIILVSHSIYISALTRKNRDLAQHLAILEHELGQHSHTPPSDDTTAAADARPKPGERLSQAKDHGRE